MNFYTLTSKATLKPNQWLRSIALLTFLISFLIFSVNYIVDPYNITKYNLLNIKHKFARDDRTEKVNYFKTLDKFDNILIGSSRVYSINPKTVSNLIGGTTYNFGVGTATVEDHLGVIKYLEKNHKLPKNIIIGIDFYTFNPNIPPNNYFLKNKELNFLSYQNYKEEYLSKFFSIDSFRASIKTLKKHIKNKNDRPRFNANGWAYEKESKSKRDSKQKIVEVKKEMEKDKTLFYSDYKYSSIDPKRKHYYKVIAKICKENEINLYLFTTPLHPLLLKDLEKNTAKPLNEFIEFLSTFENFYNFYVDSNFSNDLGNFHGATHTTNNAGEIIIHKVLTKN